MNTDNPEQLELFLVPSAERGTVVRVFEFAEVLRAADLMPLDEDEYFERPWKWQTEYEVWTDCGCPSIPDPSGPNVLRWELFVRQAHAAVSPAH